MKAFVKLAKKIKKQYPKLKILISGDALYANKTVLDICKANNWKYIIRFKEGAIPTLYKEFEQVVKNYNKSNKANYEFVTKLDYNDYKINIIRYKEIKKNKEIEFTYMTDLPISNKNIVDSIFIARKRWKIENEGFNELKNQWNMKHCYIANENAIDVILQMIMISYNLWKLYIYGYLHDFEKMEITKIGFIEEIKELFFANKCKAWYYSSA